MKHFPGTVTAQNPGKYVSQFQRENTWGNFFSVFACLAFCSLLHLPTTCCDHTSSLKRRTDGSILETAGLCSYKAWMSGITNYQSSGLKALQLSFLLTSKLFLVKQTQGEKALYSCTHIQDFKTKFKLPQLI